MVQKHFASAQNFTFEPHGIVKKCTFKKEEDCPILLILYVFEIIQLSLWILEKNLNFDKNKFVQKDKKKRQ